MGQFSCAKNQLQDALRSVGYLIVNWHGCKVVREELVSHCGHAVRNSIRVGTSDGDAAGVHRLRPFECVADGDGWETEHRRFFADRAAI